LERAVLHASQVTMQTAADRGMKGAITQLNSTRGRNMEAGLIEGEVFPSPPQRRRPGQTYAKLGHRRWYASVAKTLALQYPHLQIDHPAADGLENILRSGGTTVYLDGRVMIGGLADRDYLDRATAYHARVLFRWHEPTPEERGPHSMDPSRRPTHIQHPQVMWWYWDQERLGWHTFSLAGLSSGAQQRIGDFGSPMSSSWRGDIPSGAGYWADYEFGTEDRQILDAMPRDGENITSAMLRYGVGRQTVTVVDDALVTNGIRARRYLYHGALMMNRFVRSEKCSELWRRYVRREMGV
jgi:hypothetical protein